MDRRSGQLRGVGSSTPARNPSFLAIHPNGRVLYAVNELEQGAVRAFAIERGTGMLTRLKRTASEVARPAT